MFAAWPVGDGDDDPAVGTLLPPNGELPKTFAVWPVMDEEEVPVLPEANALAPKKQPGDRRVSLFAVNEKWLAVGVEGALVLLGTLEFPKKKRSWLFEG
jgi:hypothetical protein